MLIGLRFHLQYLKTTVLLALILAAAAAWAQAPAAPPATQTPPAPQNSPPDPLLDGPQKGPPQAQPPAAPSPSGHPLGAAPLPDIEPHPASRIEIFGGYSFLYLNANVNNQYKYSEWDGGPITSGSLWFTKRYGLQAEGAIHEQTPTSCYSSAQAGPIVRFFKGTHFSPYVHFDVGTTRLGIRNVQPCAFNFGATLGGGLDYVIPDTGNRFAFRIFQADYDYARLKYTVTNGTVTTSGTTNVDVPRISSGFVLRLGNFERPASKGIDCHTDPGTALAGEKVVLAAYARGYSFGAKYQIHWSSTAGKVIYPGPDVIVDTTGVEPGVYTATAVVTRGKSSKPLLQCSASFAVKSPPPPTLQCSAEPSTVNQADTVTITAIAGNDAQRQLYYSFNASAGQIIRTGNVAKLQTATARPGVIDITCRVQDDLGQVAEAQTRVTVTEPPPPPSNPHQEPQEVPVTPALQAPAPPPPPAPAPVPEAVPPPPAPQAPAPPPSPVEAPKPHAEKMCSITFDSDLEHPTRLDKTSMACLDQLATRLQGTPGSRVTLVGNHGAEEEDGPRLAAERTFNAKSYLVNEKFIRESRIDIRTGSSTNRSVEIYFLTGGMHYDPPPTEQNRQE